MFRSSRFKRYLLVLIVAGCAWNVKAQAPEATQKRAAIQELLNLIGAPQTAKTIFLTLIDQYSQTLAKDAVQNFAEKSWPPEVKEKARALTIDFYSRLSKRLREEVPTRLHYEEKVNRLYLDAYGEYFSEEEIQALITFYKSPTGQKFVGFGPKVSATLQEKALAEFETPTMTITKEIVAEELKELEKRAAAELKTSTPKRKN